MERVQAVYKVTYIDPTIQKSQTVYEVFPTFGGAVMEVNRLLFQNPDWTFKINPVENTH